MKQYRLANNVLGWLTFGIASIVYLLTIEPTTSFWDCGEFISSSFKLEVGHPPGAPFFMILGRFFSIFSFGDVTKVPVMVNTLSALASSFSILFLFWTITHLGYKLVSRNGAPSKSQAYGVLGSGLVGALVYTFSDTFWFSAVEGEVYATSSLFTAMVFWAILKWENVADQKYSNRWLVLIAYLMGLSIGVHLLNLLAIPAIVFVFYFKKYKVEKKGLILASVIAVVTLAVIQYGIIPGVPKVASKFERVLVNDMGMPYNSGILVYGILLFTAMIGGLYSTLKTSLHRVSWMFLGVFAVLLGIPFLSGNGFLGIIFLGIIGLAVYLLGQKHVALINFIFTIFTVILIGYSSFAMIVIRSSVNPPMDQNSPDDMFSLLSYLNREQYGDRPLVKGQYFNAPVVAYPQGNPTYIQKDGKYVVADHKVEREFDEKYTTIFPRMYSDQSSPDHKAGYANWTSVKKDQTNPPSFADNLAFFFRYQINHMYIRYFMWNFAGRQSDIQNSERNFVAEGNWISGIPFIDNARLGDQSKLPQKTKNNPANNKYYFLPLLLGILGLVLQYKNHKLDFVVVLLFFLFTGLAIVLYLNQPPYQPRERDYAYAGSFYAFAIWIGLGVLAIVEFFEKKASKPAIAAAVTVVCLAVPSIMAAENWDDHDRSGRYTARDFAYNYLNSCAPNAILFTNGDNDTFPLWYAQEVEGIRTDVRVINLSYLNTDWYIDQMKRKAYLSEAIPFSLEHDQYTVGQRDVVYLQDRVGYRNLKEVIAFIASDKPETKISGGGQDAYDFSPTRKFSVPVDREVVVANGTVSIEDTALIVPAVEWELKRNYIRKNDLMVLDLLATNNWERPVYFAVTVGPSNFAGLQDYFQLEGLAYRVVPIKQLSPDGQTGRINTSIMYQNMMDEFKWGGLETYSSQPIYMDENNRRMTLNLRNNFSRLAKQLLSQGKTDKAVKVLDRCVALFPEEAIPYSYYTVLLAEGYYLAGEMAKGDGLIKAVSASVLDDLDYYLGLERGRKDAVSEDLQRAAAILNECMRKTRAYKSPIEGEIATQMQNVMMRMGF